MCLRITTIKNGNLYYSFHLLFEKRLKYKLFRPIGLDWFANGYFRVAEPYGNPEDTIGQFLGFSSQEWDKEKALNGGYKKKGDIYHIYDKENNYEHKAITFETFKKMKFDLIVSSFPLHDNWVELLKYQPSAKYIVQLGNEDQKTSAENVLCSTADFIPTDNQKVVYYHQEFDLSDYHYNPPKNHTKISSFVVLLPEREVFLQYKHDLPEMDFKAWGPGAIDGILPTSKEISTEMRNSAFGWHIKPQDGYGHVLHKWYASGRPVILKKTYYAGKKAEPLLEDQVTCIDLDSHTYEKNLSLIRYWSKPENHKIMCRNAIKRFRKVCDFDKEAQEIKQFLSII